MTAAMRTVSIKLPDELDRALTELAERRGESRSAVIREALTAFAEQHRVSFAEAASDLAGALSGPEDLSSSKEHLDGYGT